MKNNEFSIIFSIWEKQLKEVKILNELNLLCLPVHDKLSISSDCIISLVEIYCIIKYLILSNKYEYYQNNLTNFQSNEYNF